MSQLAPPVKFKMPGWTARWSREKLIERYYIIGPRSFDRGYRQRPYATAERMFPNFLPNEIFFYGEDWRSVSDQESPDYDPLHPAFIDPDWPRYTGVDLSGRKRRGNVLITIAMSPSGIRHILDIRMGAWTAPEIIEQIDDVAKVFEPEVIFVENNALQTMLVELIEVMGLACSDLVRGFHTGSKKMDEQLGLPSLDTQFSRKQWRLSIAHEDGQISEELHGVDGCACGPCSFVHDVVTYTPADKVTPDSIMACYFAKEASRTSSDWSPESLQVGRTAPIAQIAKQVARKKSAYRIPAGMPARPKKHSGRATDGFGRPIGDYQRLVVSLANEQTEG